jgi:magnesium-transporting ATPase (P-type)
MVLSFAFRDWIEGGVVTFVIFLNVIIGFWQEFRAEQRMDSLRALASPSATVLRNGNTSVIPKCVLALLFHCPHSITNTNIAPVSCRAILSC